MSVALTRRQPNIDGYVAGMCRPVEDGIEATAFHPLSEETWDGLEAEARALVAWSMPVLRAIATQDDVLGLGRVHVVSEGVGGTPV